MPHPTPKYNERNSDEVGSQARETTNFWQHQPMKARPWRPTTASQDACAGAPNQSAEKEGREPRAGRRTTIHFSNAARWWWSWPSRVEARTRVMPALSCLACCRYESVGPMDSLSLTCLESEHTSRDGMSIGTKAADQLPPARAFPPESISANAAFGQHPATSQPLHRLGFVPHRWCA